jgi:hypothetical protein
MCIITVLFLTACQQSSIDITDTANPEISSSAIIAENDPEYLFRADDMEAIIISGDEILAGKEVEKTVNISSDEADLHISRDHPNGTKVIFVIGSYGYDLTYTIYPLDNAYLNFDDFGGAMPGYYYELSCYDFNGDGINEIIFASGNKTDSLQIYVFEINCDTKPDNDKSNTELIDDYERYEPKLIANFSGYTTAYVNEQNEICIFDNQNKVEIHQYNETK